MMKWMMKKDVKAANDAAFQDSKLGGYVLETTNE